ncbi:MAG: hypothetical protein J0H09_05220 [Burkholderiales bacterium]|nr:hypothetical protein [Burkholderiales bacterium]
MSDSQWPVYDWEHATVGDAAPPVTVAVTQEQVERYAAAVGRPAAAAAGRAAVPLLLVRAYAPLRRRELVAHMQARYPAHPTPAIKWQCQMLGNVRVGDVIDSVTRVADKYERNGRRFLKWEVLAHRGAELVARFTYVNLWEPGRPEDRQR